MVRRVVNSTAVALLEQHSPPTHRPRPPPRSPVRLTIRTHAPIIPLTWGNRASGWAAKRVGGLWWVGGSELRGWVVLA